MTTKYQKQWVLEKRTDETWWGIKSYSQWTLVTKSYEKEELDDLLLHIRTGNNIELIGEIE